MLSICSPQLGLSPESNSGGEVYDREVITRLCQKNIKIHTLLPRGRRYPQHDNLIVKHALIRSMVPPHIYNFFVLPYLLKTYLINRFDLLRVHNPYFIGPAAVSFKKLFPQVPLIASYLHLEEGINYLIDKQIIKNFNHIITISQSTKAEIIDQFNYPKSKISVAYPGVDKKFQPGPKPQDLINQYKLKNKTILLFLGGLKKRKNLNFLLKVFSQLKQPKTSLIIAGTGPLLSQLKLKASSLGIVSQVHFPGFIPESDKLKYYQLANILLLPSLKEGFGMTITEAAACAIPAIGADHFSIKEIIQSGKTGFLAQPENLNDWNQKLIQLIKSKSLRQKMGQSAQKHIRQKFSWRKNINTHLKIFNQLSKT